MLGVEYFKRIQIRAPKFFTKYFSNKTNFAGRFMPFTLGALTIFLPCGFTLTAQSLALLSGSFWQGAAIMFSFSLGTAVGLLFIGISSVKFMGKPTLSNAFSKSAGALIVFFALYNINSQLNLAGLPSLSDIKTTSALNSKKQESLVDQENMPPVVNGKQIIKMEASSFGYNPDYFKVKVNMPVRWEIKDVGTSGCTNAIVSKDLFYGQIPLSPGEVSVKEFTPTKTGRYKFSCWMGMVSGVIEVVD